MLTGDHHDWVGSAATQLTLRGDTLWQVMCSEWAKKTDARETDELIQSIKDAIDGIPHLAKTPVIVDADPLPEVAPEQTDKVRRKRKPNAASIAPPPPP
jgi:hypothetical protein